MGLFSRFTDIINANLNSMLDKAEQPEKMIRLIIGEMEETLIEVRATAAKNIAEQKTVARKITVIQKEISNWQQKAEMALTKNREDLAKSALEHKQKCLKTLNELEGENAIFTELLASIQKDSQRLQQKLSEAKSRQNNLRAREESALVRLKVRESTNIHNIDEALNKFERYQHKIDQLEAQVESYELTEDKDLSAQISALAEEDDVSTELDALKKKLATA